MDKDTFDFCFEPRIGNGYARFEIEGQARITGYGHDDVEIYIDVCGGGFKQPHRVCIDGTNDPFWAAIRKAIVDWIHETHPGSVEDCVRAYRQGTYERQRADARRVA